MEEWMRKNPVVAGQLRYCRIEHDGWCKMLRSNGKKDCNCNPTFTLENHPFLPGDFATINIFPAPPASHN